MTRVPESFWHLVARSEPDQCWPWTGGRTPEGYGYLHRDRRTLGAHRVAYELSKGSIPPGLRICHTCDNPPCCNPAHLFAGSALDNSMDMARKGRAARPQGTANPASVLDETQVAEVRELYAAGSTQAALARAFGVHPTTVHLIVRRKRWGHVA